MCSRILKVNKNNKFYTIQGLPFKRHSPATSYGNFKPVYRKSSIMKSIQNVTISVMRFFRAIERRKIDSFTTYCHGNLKAKRNPSSSNKIPVQYEKCCFWHGIRSDSEEKETKDTQQITGITEQKYPYSHKTHVMQVSGVFKTEILTGYRYFEGTVTRAYDTHFVRFKSLLNL